MSDSLRTKIRESVKAKGVLASSLGEIKVVGNLLGEGGNAIVFPVEFGNAAAVKILAEDLTTGLSTKLKRFIAEYRLLVTLPSHPNVLRLFHFDTLQIEAHRFPYIVMERCSKTLKEHVKESGGKLPSEQLRRLMDDLVAGLAHLHAHRIVHRDIKPENILLRDDGSFVIADFGIAWFDPELYDRNFKTQKGERMANFGFSAPEQIVAGYQPHPTADLFALGQVLYWCVTGDIIRGAGFQALGQVDPAYAEFDPAISLMVQQDASRRLQLASDVKSHLLSAKKRREEIERDQQVLSSLDEFDHIICRTLPGIRGIHHEQDPQRIDDLLTELAKNARALNLYWTRGNQDNSVTNIHKIGPSNWVIDYIELHITDVWVNKSADSQDHQFVLLRSAPMPPFGVDPSPGDDYDMAAIFNGQYFSTKEHDDGYARISGKIVDVRGSSKVRRRNMKEHYLFLATTYHAINIGFPTMAERLIAEIVKQIELSGAVDPLLLEKINQLPIHKTSAMYR